METVIVIAVLIAALLLVAMVSLERKIKEIGQDVSNLKGWTCRHDRTVGEHDLTINLIKRKLCKHDRLKPAQVVVRTTSVASGFGRRGGVVRQETAPVLECEDCGHQQSFKTSRERDLYHADHLRKIHGEVAQ